MNDPQDAFSPGRIALLIAGVVVIIVGVELTRMMTGSGSSDESGIGPVASTPASQSNSPESAGSQTGEATSSGHSQQSDQTQSRDESNQSEPEPPQESEPEMPAPEPEQEVAASKDNDPPASVQAAGLELTEFAYLPPDPELIVSIRFSKLWNSPWLNALQESPSIQTNFQAVANQMTQIGFPPDQIERIQIGASDLPQNPPSPGMVPPQIDLSGKMTLVIRSKQPLDAEKLLNFVRSQLPSESEVQEKSYRQITYYEIPAPKPPTPGDGFPTPPPGSRQSSESQDAQTENVAAFLPNPSTLVICPAEQVNIVIEQGNNTELPDRFQFVDSSQHLMFAISPGERSESSASPQMGPLNDVRALSLGMTFADQINWSLSGQFPDPGSAQPAAKQLQGQVRGLQQMYQEWSRKSASKEFADVWQLGQSVLDSAKVNQSDSTVSVAGEIPGIQMDVLGQMPMALMSAMGFSDPGQMAGLSSSLMPSPGFSLGNGNDDSAPDASSSSAAQPVRDLEDAELRKELILTYEKPFGVFPPEEQEPLYATLKLRGAKAAQATHYGQLKIANCELGDGTKLERVESPFSMNDSSGGFVEVNRTMMYGGQQKRPDDEIQIHLMLERPGENVKVIGQLDGELQVITASGRKTLSFPNIKARAGESLDNPDLNSSGLKIQVLKQDSSEAKFLQQEPGKTVLIKVEGPRTALLDMSLVDADDNELQTDRMWSAQSSDKPAYYSLQAKQDLPEATQLNLKIALDQKKWTVPFEFQEVSLPEKGASTEASDSGQSSPPASSPLEKKDEGSGSPFKNTDQ